VLYLRGISTKDFEPALAEFFGSEAGLSASAIQRLKREWSAKLRAFRQRDLSQVDYVYLWPTVSISTSVWSRTACTAWCWSACAPTGTRSWSRLVTATANQANPGPSC